MKNSLKIFSIVIIAIMIAIIVIPTVSKAFNANDIIGGVNSSAESASVDTTAITTKAGNVLALIRNIAVIAGVLIIAILGVKYMLGSVEEKAEYKKSAIPLIVGVIVVMAATSIATFIFSIV